MTQANFLPAQIQVLHYMWSHSIIPARGARSMNFSSFVRLSCVLLLVSVACIHPLRAQRAPNANAYYQQLRGLLPGGEVITVKDFVIKRDAATFTFQSGNVAFFGQVNGKVTGAVFSGEGHIHITPPTAEERHNLQSSRTARSSTRTSTKWFCALPIPPPTSCARLRPALASRTAPTPEQRRMFETFLRHHAEGSYIEPGSHVLLQEALRQSRSAPA